MKWGNFISQNHGETIGQNKVFGRKISMISGQIDREGLDRSAIYNRKNLAGTTMDK